MGELGSKVLKNRRLSGFVTALSIVAIALVGVQCCNGAISGAAGASEAGLSLRAAALQRSVSPHSWETSAASSQEAPSESWRWSGGGGLVGGLSSRPGGRREPSPLVPPRGYHRQAFTEGKTRAATSVGVHVSSTPALNLEETEDCILAEPPLPNAVREAKEVEAKVTLWAEHVNDEAHLRGTTKAYQTTETPGREREFALSFALPDHLVDGGKATLTLTKTWDGEEHGWGCLEHVLQLIRLSDAKYQEGRNALSLTADVVEQAIGNELTVYQVDVSSLVYGKGLHGEFHVLVREKHTNCLSAFAPPGSPEGGIVLKVQTEETDDRDAVYGEWSPFSPCRLSCITSVNFQCRKRSCSPGANAGAACLAHLMVDKQPCSDASLASACSCQELIEHNACPEGSYCDSAKFNDVKCLCPGVFARNSVLEPTVCKLSTSASGSLLGDSSASQDSSTGVSGVSDSAGTSSSTSLQSGSDGSHLMAVWIVMGVVLSLIALACLALVCFKRKPPSEEDLLGASIDPYTGHVSTGAGGGMGGGLYGGGWGGANSAPPLGPGGFPAMNSAMASSRSVPSQSQRGPGLYPSSPGAGPGAGVRRSVSGWTRSAPGSPSGTARQMGY